MVKCLIGNLGGLYVHLRDYVSVNWPIGNPAPDKMVVKQLTSPGVYLSSPLFYGRVDDPNLLIRGLLTFRRNLTTGKVFQRERISHAININSLFSNDPMMCCSINSFFYKIQL